jgi:ankyrin repeat protein
MGAEVDAKDDEGNTPLHSAVRASAHETCRTLVEGGADVNARSERGFTPLHVAALHSDAEAARLLLAAGAELNMRDNKGETTLHLAAICSHSGNQCWRIVAVLVAWGADVKIPAANGTTPLDVARAGVAARGDPETAAIVAILEGAIARQKIARIESQLTLAATCALICAGGIALGFAVITVKMLRQRRNRPPAPG